MKHLFITTLALMSAIVAFAQNVEDVCIYMRDTNIIETQMVEFSDTTITIKERKDVKIISVNDFYKVTRHNLPTLVSKSGKIVEMSGDELREYNKFHNYFSDYRERVIDNEKHVKYNQSDPNYIIGYALRTSGDVAIGVGITSLLTGVGCLIYGNSGTLKESKAKAQEAGLALVSIGTSLTIISIPLEIGGKKVMDLSIITDGSSVGTAIKF